ncbi:MAG TPA: carboxypeptidase-like regulatory domain-containing protein [Bryobacteraceae bacterium]
MTSVLVLALVLAQQATPPEKATLSGTVVDSITGQPLDKVRVIADHRHSEEPGASTTTDSKGEFTLVDLDPGEYQLGAKRSGYLETYYGAKGPRDDGSPIILTASQSVEDLRMKLTPFGVIAGTVRDSDGEPFAGAAVDLFGIVWQNGRRTISSQTDELHTDDLGQFRIAGLKPGRYFLAAAASRRSDEDATVDHSPKTAPHSDPAVTTFYPGTIDPDSATPIDLAPGGRQMGADITLIHSRLHKVIVHIQAAPGLRTYGHLLYATEGFGEVGHERNSNKEALEIVNVPSGSYILRFGAVVPQKSTPGVYDLTNSSDGCGSAIPVSINKEDTVEINAVAPGCAHITGHITTDAGKPLKDAGGFGYEFVRDNEDDGHYFVKADGSFRLTVSPGQHTLDFRDITNSNNIYLKTIRSGSQDLLQSGLTLSGGDHLDIEVVFGSDGGRVEGVVSDPDGKPAPAATVVLIPNEAALRTRPDHTPSVTTTHAGHYELKGIAPGGYKLFAFENIEKDTWLDPDVLRDYESRGAPVNVKPGDPDTQESPAQTVDLKLIQ